MNKGVIIAVVLALVVLGGFFLVSSGDDDTSTATVDNQTDLVPPTQDTTSDAAEPSEEPANEGKISAAEVSNHAVEGDCWTIVDGSVYDITSYIPRHPGGAEILKACGTDGSSLFNSRTTADGQTIGSGTAHSSNASSQLAGFLIGELE